jgi:hypothetical protein
LGGRFIAPPSYPAKFFAQTGFSSILAIVNPIEDRKLTISHQTAQHCQRFGARSRHAYCAHEKPPSVFSVSSPSPASQNRLSKKLRHFRLYLAFSANDGPPTVVHMEVLDADKLLAAATQSSKNLNLRGISPHQAGRVPAAEEMRRHPDRDVGDRKRLTRIGNGRRGG